MMPPTLLVLNGFLPLNAIRLGRFVLDVKIPQLDFLDPSGVEPPYTSRAMGKVEELFSNSAGSSIQSNLTQLISGSRNKENQEKISLSGTQSCFYQLMNSRAWFAKACTSAETRKWLEEALKDDCKVYLVIAYCTIVDARLEGKSLGNTSLRSSMQLPDISSSLALGGMPMPLIGDSKIAVSTSKEASAEREGKGEFPGECVCAAQFRKVEFKWYRRKEVESSFLEKGNRWIVYSGTRGEDDDEDEDILEAELGE